MKDVVISRNSSLWISSDSILQHVTARYRGVELDHFDSPRQAFFAGKHACLRVDCSKFNDLISFQKFVLDNTNCIPPDCHHNILLMQLWLWELFGGLTTIKPLTESFTNIIKDPIFVRSNNSFKKLLLVKGPFIEVLYIFNAM